MMAPKKLLSLAILSVSIFLPASAHEVSKTHVEQTSIPIQIGHAIYDCQIDPLQTRSVISRAIYRAQRQTLGLDHLTYHERRAQNLPIRFGERYLSQLPLHINGRRLDLEHAIVSDHNKGFGLCVGKSSRSTYGGAKRSNCSLGIGLKVVFSTKGSSSEWCVIGQDVLTQPPVQSNDVL